MDNTEAQCKAMEKKEVPLMELIEKEQANVEEKIAGLQKYAENLRQAKILLVDEPLREPALRAMTRVHTGW